MSPVEQSVDGRALPPDGDPYASSKLSEMLAHIVDAQPARLAGLEAAAKMPRSTGSHKVQPAEPLLLAQKSCCSGQSVVVFVRHCVNVTEPTYRAVIVHVTSA